jgi:hypothetical protein
LKTHGTRLEAGIATVAAIANPVYGAPFAAPVHLSRGRDAHRQGAPVRDIHDGATIVPDAKEWELVCRLGQRLATGRTGA